MRRATLALVLIGLINSSLFAESAQEILAKNGCMKCHSINGMKYAPPFSMIIGMNEGWFGLNENDIKNSIKYGSQGKYPMFSNTKMPAYKNLTNKEINTLVAWLKSLKGMRDNMMNRHMMQHNMMKF
ncbi:c-type cytochrome [Sulfurospirillum sp. 1612]|uniref:c-type cytochrome n=1 Tax=Sulfurospirillum sp. 1612 TaxID=3094835 RepID=UPI002F92FA48